MIDRQEVYQTRRRVDEGCFVGLFARRIDKGLKSTRSVIGIKS